MRNAFVCKVYFFSFPNIVQCIKIFPIVLLCVVRSSIVLSKKLTLSVPPCMLCRNDISVLKGGIRFIMVFDSS